MYTVTIRKNDTGEERSFQQDDEWQEHSDFMWTEGNYACDCNRAIFFAEAGGEDEPEVTCSDGKYSIVSIVLADGTKVV